MRKRVPAPRDVSCVTFELAGHELLLLSFPLPTIALPPGLSPAEREVVSALVSGDSPEKIASARGKSVNTVRNQLRNVYKKLGVSTSAELVRLCFQSEGAELADG
jgi:DNA-binding CsgD family transcriptional regulator